MTKITNFDLRIKFEDKIVYEKKADKLEELEDSFKFIKRKFR